MILLGSAAIVCCCSNFSFDLIFLQFTVAGLSVDIQLTLKCYLLNDKITWKIDKTFATT